VEISSGYDHPLNPGLLAFTISGTPTAIENAKLQIFYAVVRAGVIMLLAIAHTLTVLHAVSWHTACLVGRLHEGQVRGQLPDPQHWHRPAGARPVRPGQRQAGLRACRHLLPAQDHGHRRHQHYGRGRG
jgi:hypothetical protein